MAITYGYNQRAMIPDDGDGWDRYGHRLSRYDVLNGYYYNVAYFQIQAYSQSLKYYEKLYKHVRGVYNPVNRLVELYVSKVYPGSLDMDTAETGAIPIRDAKDQFRTALIQLWQWSNWSRKKALFVRDGSRFGDGFIKVVDDIQRERVRMEVVDPRKIKSVEKAGDETVTRAEFEYMIPDPEGGNHSVRYTEIVTPELFRTEINGQPAAVHTNGQGNLVDSWDNDYGFVPLVHVMHRDLGLNYGGTPYSGSLHKINELNDLASIINDGARGQVKMPLVSIGVRGNITVGTDQSENNTSDTSDTPKKDEVTIVNLPNKEADLKSIAPSINLQDAYVVVTGILEELERDNPELALWRVRQSGNITAPGVRAAFDDGASRINDGKDSFDGGLIPAQRMAVAIGGFRGYDGFDGFGLDDIDSNATLHVIGDRPIIGDTLGLAEKLNWTIQAAGSPAAETVYNEMGYSQAVIDSMLEAGNEQLAAADLASAPLDNNPPNPNAVVTEQDVEEAQALI